MKKYIILIILLIIGISFYNYKTHQHITLIFENIRPFEGKIPVFYKGLAVGKAVESYHSDDLQHTHIKITLYSKKLKLPANTEAVLKKRIKNKKEYDYLELIYPDSPDKETISENSFIHGKSTVDIREYFISHTIEDIDKIENNLIQASENLNLSLEALTGLFVVIQDMVQENRQNILEASHNLNQTSKNINTTTKKFENSIKTEQLKQTFDYIENSTDNLNKLTSNVSDATSEMNITTIPDINSTIKSANNLLGNLNSITCGIKQTLNKKFGGLRLLFRIKNH